MTVRIARYSYGAAAVWCEFVSNTRGARLWHGRGARYSAEDVPSQQEFILRKSTV